MQQQTKLRVRLYARLSKDDGDADKESNSITNQLQMLRNDAKKKGFEIVGEYIDDGYSGTTFNRPELKRMIDDAISDKDLNGIMVKDLSRFGRNNAMVMFYISEVFPNHNIQFIALNDNIDTRFDENEMMPFKSIMNEYYARDISKKIRSVKTMMAYNGDYLGSISPYGYEQDPNNRHRLIPDEITSVIVLRIFRMLLEGYSAWKIANIFCREGILIPRAYYAEKHGKFQTSKSFKHPTGWTAKVIKGIAANPVYLGHTVSNKSHTKSFKNKKIVYVPSEDWIVVKNTHPALIDQQTFDLVQKLLPIKKHAFRQKDYDNIFIGLVKCSDCGCNLVAQKKKDKIKLRCAKYSRNTSLCTNHYIDYDTLKSIILTDIRKYVQELKFNGNEFYEKMRILNEQSGLEKIKSLEQDISKIKKRIDEIDRVISKLFEQSVLGMISENRYQRMSIVYENEQSELMIKLKKLLEQKEKEKENTQQTDQFMNIIIKYENVTELNRVMLCELVENIYVHQAIGKGKNRVQKVDIKYRFLNVSV